MRVVLRTPAYDFEQNRQQVNPLETEPVAAARPPARTRLFLDNPVLFEANQTVGKHIGGNAFFRMQKVGVANAAFEHQVADDEQRPGVTEYFNGEVNGAVGFAVAASHGWHA